MNSRRRLPVWFLAPCLLSFAQVAQSYDFKGIEVGGPTRYSRQQIEESLGLTCEVEERGSLTCNGPTTIADVAAKAMVAIHPSGIVMQIFVLWPFDPYKNFLLVELAAKEKYGTPSRDRRSRKKVMYSDYPIIKMQWGQDDETRVTLETGPTGSTFRIRTTIYDSWVYRIDVLATDGEPAKAPDL